MSANTEINKCKITMYQIKTTTVIEENNTVTDVSQ